MAPRQLAWRRTAVLVAELGAQAAEVWVPEHVVRVTVHVGEQLHDHVAVEAQLHLVCHVGEVAESHVAECPQVELLECGGDLPEPVHHRPSEGRQVGPELLILPARPAGMVDRPELPAVLLPRPRSALLRLVERAEVAEFNLLQGIAEGFQFVVVRG